ncbi:hypothetical protein ACFWD7_58260 [Streptomyces mirabilis]|uniref:hypothetical protein n=1 Tax=Streptomyces mirabilis TaxID=68239 RepID=UPI0036B432B3
MNEDSYGQRILEASLEGLPVALQGIGTITRNLKAYGAGVAINGMVGLKQVIDETQRYLQIYWHPDHIHPKPNYYKAASGVVNIAGATIYGASSAGILGPTLGGAGAIAQGLSYYTTKLLPQDAGTYYPPLPVHHHQRHSTSPQMLPRPTSEIVDRNISKPLSGTHAYQPGSPSTAQTPLAFPGGTTLARAAAMRPEGHENQTNERSAAQTVNDPYASRLRPGAVAHRNGAQRPRRNSL